MRYAQIRSMDVTNGTGLRVSVFVQGCAFHCKNCFNSDTWDFNGGKEWNDEVIDKIIKLADRDEISGLSILGGEPLHPANLKGVNDLIVKFSEKFPDKNIWMWTGYTLEELSKEQLDVVHKIDVLIDGRFIDELKDMKLAYRGSSNQRIIKISDIIEK